MMFEEKEKYIFYLDILIVHENKNYKSLKHLSSVEISKPLHHSLSEY